MFASSQNGGILTNKNIPAPPIIEILFCVNSNYKAWVPIITRISRDRGAAHKKGRT